MASSKLPLSFKAAALKSGLVDQATYSRVAEMVGGEDEQAISDMLVKSGRVTGYQANQLHAGRTKLSLGPYLITDWIGQGGMGQVFKAVHGVMGRVCAVKVLPLEKSTPQSRDSFMREIRLQAELDHPCVVRAFDAGRDGNVHYLVTEFVPGTDLRRLVRDSGPLPQNRAAAIIAQVARGLQYAHDIGLVHRDIKPGNILVTPEGLAKLSDIGLATWTMGLDDDPRAGKIVGTADYLSPEQIQTPRNVGNESDIYSLGCTTYYTVTGKVPFPGGDSRSKCKRHCEQTPWHPRKFAPDLSEDFVDAIADMMEKDRSRRTGSATEVAARMEQWVDSDLSYDQPISRRSWMPPPPPHESAPQDRSPPGRRSGTRSGSLSRSSSEVRRSSSGSSIIGSAADQNLPSIGVPTLDLESPPSPDASRAMKPPSLLPHLLIWIPLATAIGVALGYGNRDWITTFIERFH